MNYYNKTIIHELALLSNDFLRSGMLLILLRIIVDRIGRLLVGDSLGRYGGSSGCRVGIDSDGRGAQRGCSEIQRGHGSEAIQTVLRC